MTNNTKIIVDDIPRTAIPLSDAVKSYEFGTNQYIWFVTPQNGIKVLIPQASSVGVHTYAFVDLNDLLDLLTRFGFSNETNSSNTMFQAPSARETIEYAVHLNYDVFVSPTTGDFFESVGLFLDRNKQQ
jgi:hypothetical protein